MWYVEERSTKSVGVLFVLIEALKACDRRLTDAGVREMWKVR